MKSFNKFLEEKNGLWANIHAKRKRGEKPNPPGHPDRPTAQDFKDAQKTSKNESWGDKMPKSERPGWVKDPKTGQWVKPTQVKKENYVSHAQRKAVWAARNDEKKKANEAKDGDGANIVKDREFKGKPSKTIPHAKPGEPGHNTHATMFKKDGPKPAWMARKEKMKKEAVELDEDITKMSHGRLKFHMNNKHVPHGSYSWDQMKAERDRRLSKVDTHAAYKKAKPGLSEESKINEISKKTLGSYVKKASSDMANNAYALGARDPLKKPGSWDKAFKRKDGIAKATDKLAKESVEEAANHGNMNNGSPAGEGLSPSAKKELARKTPAPNDAFDVNTVNKKTFDAIRASAKKAPMRNNDNAQGDKTPPKGK